MVRFFLRRFHSIMVLRIALSLLAFVAICATSAAPTFAAGGQTGNLQGTVVDATSNAPIANATITASAPAGSFVGHTDGKGFFSILGLNVDTYTVSVQAQGYQAVSLAGTTVPGDQILNLGTIRLTKALRTIARTTSRALAGAFQPGQTTDSFTVSGNRILQSVGKTDTTNENNIILSVPGVSLTNSQVPTIRGGAPTEVGFQLDGIPFQEPFLYGNGSFNRVNGVGTIQVVEGAGDATQGDVGSGVINVIPKRGEYPGTGQLDFEAGGPNFSHQFAADYGIATRSGNVSNYLSYIGQRFVPYYGYSFTNPNNYGNGLGSSYQAENQILDNLVFKFGHNNAQSLQMLYSNQNIQTYGNAGGIVTNPNVPGYFSYWPNNPLSGNEFFTGAIGAIYGPAGLARYPDIIGLTPYTSTNPNAPITGPEETVAANTRFLKFEYDNNLDANTFLALRYFNWEQLQADSATYAIPANGLANYSSIGGARTGGILDISRQIGSKLTLSVNGSYQVLHPIWNDFEPQLALIGAGFLGPQSPAPNYGDFLPGGYLSQFPVIGNNIPRMDNFGINYNGAFFQEYGIGLRAQYQPTSRLKFDLGVRTEQQYQHFFNPYLGLGNPRNPFDVLPQDFTASTLDPHATQPRASVSYQAGPNDSFRFGYGRSAVFVNAQTAGTPFQPYLDPRLSLVPPKPGGMCGLANFGGLFPCQNYAQQLYWQGDALEAPDAGGSNVALYSNYDFTYQHRFRNGFGLHVTPFYKLGTDLPAASLLATLAGGQQIFGPNDTGFNRTTGAEFELTTPEVPTGFSGFLSMTYQNVLQSAPPLSNGEDTEPQLSSATLALGNLYRAGYISPFVARVGGTYNFKNGLRVTPVIEYDRGYPYNIGELIAGQLPNGTYTNVPQVNFGPGISPLVGYQNAQGTTISTNYYDPAFPGTTLNPNVAATRGTPTSASNGGVLYKPNVTASLTAEYHLGRNVFGATALNLFGNAYNGAIPLINPYYQPVATGLSGPLTGINPLTPTYGVQRAGTNLPTDTYAFTNGAYVLSKGTSQILAPLQPTTFTFYYQYKL